MCDCRDCKITPTVMILLTEFNKVKSRYEYALGMSDENNTLVKTYKDQAIFVANAIRFLRDEFPKNHVWDDMEERLKI